MSDRADLFWRKFDLFLGFKAKSTQIGYYQTLRRICEFLELENGTAIAAEKLLAVTDEDCLAFVRWLAHRKGQGHPKLADSTIRVHVLRLTCLYRYMGGSRGLGLSYNPFQSAAMSFSRTGASGRRRSDAIPAASVRKLIAAPDSSPRGRRDRALFVVLFGGGLRKGEAIRLRVGDVKISGAASSTLFLQLIKTKNKRSYDQILPVWASEIISEYVAIRHSQGARVEDWLFLAGAIGNSDELDSHKHISANSVNLLFKKYAASQGLTEKLSPHWARCTAITRLLERGVSHRDVQMFSRHETVTSVETYDRLRRVQDRAVAEKLTY